MSRFRVAALALVAALTFPVAASAGTAVAVKVQFFAQGSPGFLDIEGVTEQMTVTDDGTTMTFTVPMESVKTGIDERDEHMNHKYVDTAHFPNAVLHFAKADIAWPTETGAKVSGKVNAVFNVHGKDQPVTVEYTVTRGKSGTIIDASFKYDASASGVEIPSYAGVTVDPKQSAKVKFTLKD